MDRNLTDPYSCRKRLLLTWNAQALSEILATEDKSKTIVEVLIRRFQWLPPTEHQESRIPKAGLLWAKLYGYCFFAIDTARFGIHGLRSDGLEWMIISVWRDNYYLDRIGFVNGNPATEVSKTVKRNWQPRFQWFPPTRQNRIPKLDFVRAKVYEYCFLRRDKLFGR